MSSVLMGFVLDVLVLIFLGFTMYFALRLSKSLNNFRVDKKEMKALIGTLSKNIELAQNAIEGLKVTSHNSGKELQNLIHESRALFDELQIMNEAGNGLARRLETLAERRQGGTPQDLPDSDYAQEERPNSDRGTSFLIQDRDFEESDDDDFGEAGFGWNDGDDRDQNIPEDLQSQAEKELYRALQQNKKKRSAGGRH